MPLLYHHPLSPACRFIRMVLKEHDIEPDLQQEFSWERRPEFLELNPAGEVPVLQEDNGDVIVGVQAIAEYIDETYGKSLGNKRLMQQEPIKRAENRRLMQWAFVKMKYEVVHHFLNEKVYKRQKPAQLGGGAPDTVILRAGRQNIIPHMRYIGSLIRNRHWIGDTIISYADFAFAAVFSSIDYLNEVPWDEEKDLREWYARMKSRPSMRSILNDVVRGIGPPSHYANPDF